MEVEVLAALHRATQYICQRIRPSTFPRLGVRSLALPRSFFFGLGLSQPNLFSALSLSLPLLHTLYLFTHEYSERRQMSQIHHLRDAVAMEKSQSTYEWGM